MKQYHFVTQWFIEAPRQAVWDVIESPEQWPAWWRGVTAVEPIARGVEDGTGSIIRYTFRSALPYDLVFDMRTTAVDRPRYLEGEASGDLAGTGRWYLAAIGEHTSVRYEWDVATTHAWMNAAAPLLGPLFRWNHDVVMRWGEHGLRERLGIAAVPHAPRRTPAIAAAAAGLGAGIVLVAAFARARRA